MVPLKWGCKGVRGVWGGKMDVESDGEAPPTWDILTNIEVAYAPHLLCGTLVGGPCVALGGW